MSGRGVTLSDQATLYRTAEFGFAGFGDDNHRRAQQPAIERPGLGPCLDDRAGGVGLAFLLRHGLVKIRIERLADRVLLLDPVPLQRADEAAFPPFQALA